MKAARRTEGLAPPGRLQLELRLTIEHAVTRILEESASIEQAAPRVIAAVREHLPWLSEGRWLPEGQAAEAPARGMHSAFSFPVGVPGRPAGAMEFFTREAHRADAELLDCMGYLGRQLGQFIERTRAEDERRRFRTAMDVSAELILLVDPRQIRYLDANETACRLLGYTREELLRLGPHDIFSASREELARTYQRVIAGDPAATAAEGWYRRKDGSRFLVESFRRALPAPGGHLIVAVARDIGERRRQQGLLALEHTVTRCLSEADDAAQALKSVMRAVCEANGWECGRYFRRDPATGAFAFWESWNVGIDAVQRFIDWSRDKSYAPGVGLVGRVGESGQPLWVPDVSSDVRVAHQALADEYRMRGAFIFPVMSRDATLGVLAFNSREIREPDERLLQAARVIGSQIGQFLQRKQAEDEVRRSEERFRSLTELSSDFYWETDAQHRLVQTQYAAEHKPIVPSARRLGKTRWELPSTRPDAGGWAAFRGGMERHEPFRDFEFARVDQQGVERHVSISGEPMFDAAGGFTGYRGIGKDITDRKRAELLLDLEHTVTRCLAEAEDGPQAVRAVMRAICEANGWECGRYFRRHDDGRFRLAESWHLPNEAIERFIVYSAQRTFETGIGVVGRAAAGEPQWVADVGSDARVVHPMMAKEHGMRGAFMFPVMAQGSALGVLSFTSREIREPDERLLKAVRVIGSQIGQFLQRKQAEQVMRESEERFRALTQLSSDFYWETDAQHRIVQTRYDLERRPVVPNRFGKTRWEMASTHPDAAGWAAHRATMQAHRPFRDFEFARIGDDGVERHLSISGEPVFDRAGTFTGYRGVGKDITARKREEHLLALEHAVTRCLAQDESAGAALRAVIREICQSQGWECGRYFYADESAALLRFGESWGIDDPAIQRYLERSRTTTYSFEREESSKVRVWRTREPVWSSDVSRKAGLARSILGGPRDSFTFAVVSGGEALGVLCFTHRLLREPDERLLQAVRVIGSQIGQFLKRKRAEEVMRDSEERFRSLTLLSSDIYWEQDQEFRFTQLVGTGSARVKQGNLRYIGKKRWEQSYVNMGAGDWEKHIELLEAHLPFHDLELCRLDEEGKKVWLSVSGEPVFDAAGRFKGYRGVGKDITARKLDEEYIHYLANHDALTALPNRFMFSQIVNHAIQNARRHNRGLALLFVDLDRFKVINDALGHEAGDRLLKEMAQRLADTVRSSDVVARLGGDEFVVLVQEVSDAQQVEIVARKVLAALIRPIPIGEHEYRVTASIGISMYPGDGEDEQSLMKNADIAMYAAKEDGKNAYKFYSAEANVHSFERLRLEAGLRRGLEENQFLLHYQPKVDVASGAVTGMEALVRWQHPELGMVPPGQFIPLAEESGLVVPLGKWVLRTACAQAMAWRRAGLPGLRMSVNISARQFADEELLKDIADALAESGMPPQLLELELTESMVMRSPERALTVLQALERMGVRLAIDDFGVGYSSFAHLKRFPLDTLKIDRSLIRDIPQDADDKAIAEAVIAMGKSLNLSVVAEGVETAEQHSFLREHGCDEAQGYYFSKPLAAEAAAEFLLREASTG